MTAEKSTLKRKPLSDCTNIITDAAASSRRKSSLKSTFAHSLRKSSVQAPTASLKSYTSTGSNATTGSSVRSSADPPNRSSHPQTRSSHDDLPKCQPSSTQGERQNNQKKKDKGKAVKEDCMIEKSHPSKPSFQQLSSSSASGDDTKSEPSSIQDKSQNDQRKKDKGKAPMVDSTIETSHPSTPRHEKLLFAAIDAFAKSRSSSVSVTQDFTIETTLPSTPSCQKPPSAASGTIIPLASKSRTACNPRKASRNKKQEPKKPTEIFSCPPGKRLKDQLNNESGDGITGSRTDPGPAVKKRSGSKRKDLSLHAMPKEEVEKLKAYYADIDAFELPVEEPGDSDLD